MSANPLSRLVPMPPTFDAAEELSTVWRTTFESIHSAANADQIVSALTGYEPGRSPKRRDEMVSIAAAVLMQGCIQEGTLRVFVRDDRCYRVPAEAFGSASTGQITEGFITPAAQRHVAHSLSTGQLHWIDTPQNFGWLVDLKLPLLTTIGDAEHVRRRLLQMVQLPGEAPVAVNERGGTADSSRKFAARVKALTASIQEEPLWNLVTTLYWIGLRDAGGVAEAVACFEEAPGSRQSGTVIARVHLVLVAYSGNDELPTVHEGRPDELLLAALKQKHVVASGFAGGTGPRTDIPQHAWADLVLIDGPRQSDGDAGAFLARWFIEGGPFWTRLRFDRETVVRAFPEQAPKGTRAAERRAEIELRGFAEAHRAGAPIPVKVHWREEAQMKHGISARSTDRVWARVATDFPELSERKGKPRPRPSR